MPTRRHMRSAILTLALLLAGSLAATESDDPVLAVVGGAEIHASRVDRGVPTGTFGSARRSVRMQRLSRLVDEATFRQALAEAGATVDEAAVDAAFAEASKEAPPPPCSCFSYRDYDDYLAQNLMTREDARAELWIRAGIDQLATRAWETAHPGPDALAGLVRSEGPAIRADYRRWWHLVCFIPTEEAAVPGSHGPTWSKVEAARQRILHGEDPARVARDVDQNLEEGQAGGAAGILSLSDASALGLEPAVVASLPPSVLSEPLNGYMSCHLLRWDPLTDAEVLDHLHRRFLTGFRQDFVDRALASRRVEYRGAGKDLAPKAAAP